MRQFYKVRTALLQPCVLHDCLNDAGLSDQPQLNVQGGFLQEMNKREAAQILGTRESAGEDRVREAHLRIMKANHPDLGGSSYLAEKVNEAKDLLLGKGKRRTSPF